MLFTKKGSSSDFPWKLLAVEAVLVVTSVLLALALNSWRQSRSNNALAERAVQEFIDEVKINCSSILTHQPYHQAVVKGEREPQGIQLGLLRNDAWDVAKTIGATPHLEYNIAAKIGEIGAQQSDHRAMVQAYLQALFTVALQFEEPDEWHREGERAVINDLLRIQTSLLEEYQNLLVLVEKDFGNTIETAGVCEQ